MNGGEDLGEKFEKWQRTARERIEEIDRKLGISEKVESSIKSAAEQASRGAEKLKSEAEKTELGKEAVRITESTVEAAGSAAKAAWDASQPLREKAESAAGSAAKVAADAAKTIADKISDTAQKAGSAARSSAEAFSFGLDLTSALDSASRRARQAAAWVSENPLYALSTAGSGLVGAGLGLAFTTMSSHWLMNSALPVWMVKLLSKRFNGYLKSQEEKLAAGKLDEAEQERLAFQKDIALYVGAPMIAGFAFSSGAVLLANVLDPKTITGAPLSWLIGGSPFLEGIWFFANGVVCIKCGIDVVFMALGRPEAADEMINKARKLLPSA
ncbi:MAG TPA: hypothetical protein VNK26_00130 [Pyrinomonadaceae bacterium]|nr:hypothetical protein [Pyrinomonadaceae bacterium]